MHSVSFWVQQCGSCICIVLLLKAVDRTRMISGMLVYTIGEYGTEGDLTDMTSVQHHNHESYRNETWFPPERQHLYYYESLYHDHTFHFNAMVVCYLLTTRANVYISHTVIVFSIMITIPCYCSIVFDYYQQ